LPLTNKGLMSLTIDLLSAIGLVVRY